jgi:hypothetical protein
MRLAEQCQLTVEEAAGALRSRIGAAVEPATRLGDGRATRIWVAAGKRRSTGLAKRVV